MPLGMESETREEWHVSWSAIYVGTLAAIAAGLIVGLIGISVGAHTLGPADRVVSWSRVGLGTLILSIFGAFLSFAAGGWVAGTIAGLKRAETAMLYGAIVWMTAVPILLLLAALGAGNYFGGWIGNLAGTPTWVTPANQVDPNAAQVIRNSALGAVTALLLGLMGGVVGGWIASGEPMSIGYYLRSTESRVRREIPGSR